jgi:hypothetical protein
MTKRPTLKVSKTDVAKRQIETAIRLWFFSGDPVSIHTLAAAAHQILHDLGNLENCIVYYNTGPDASSNYFGDTTLNYCCTFPLPNSGLGNITNERSFVNLTNFNFQLQSNSPCINSGKNSNVTTTTDYAGNLRIVGGTVDIGAYKFQSPSSVLSCAWAQQFGLPTDGTADFTDTDDDGLNNWQEWIVGTVPTNSASVLKLFSPSNNVPGLKVCWQSVSGVIYSSPTQHQPHRATDIFRAAEQHCRPGQHDNLHGHHRHERWPLLLPRRRAVR